MKYCQIPLPVAPARMATYRRPAESIARGAFMVGVICGAALSAVLFLLESVL